MAVWIASVTAVVDAMAFAETATAKIMFVGVATLWFTTTTIGMLPARTRRFAEQHEWMVRSYSLSLFFLTFSVWVPALASTSLAPRGLSAGAVPEWGSQSRRGGNLDSLDTQQDSFRAQTAELELSMCTGPTT